MTASGTGQCSDDRYDCTSGLNELARAIFLQELASDSAFLDQRPSTVDLVRRDHSIRTAASRRAVRRPWRPRPAPAPRRRREIRRHVRAGPATMQSSSVAPGPTRAPGQTTVRVRRASAAHAAPDSIALGAGPASRSAASQVVARRADVDERASSRATRACAPGRVRHELAIDARDRLGRRRRRRATRTRSRARPGRRRSASCRPAARPAGTKPVTRSSPSSADAVVVIRRADWARPPCVTSAPRASCCAIIGASAKSHERVAVDDQKRVGVEERQRVSRAAGRSENRLLPRVAHADAQVRAVADDGGNRLGPVVQVEHDVGHALRSRASRARARSACVPRAARRAWRRGASADRGGVPRPAVRTSAGSMRTQC